MICGCMCLYKPVPALMELMVFHKTYQNAIFWMGVLETCLNEYV